MKVRLLGILLAVVAVFGISAGRAAAAPYPAHGQQITFTVNGCTLNFQHGNAFAGAYAQIRRGNDTDCLNNTSVKVTGWNGSSLVTKTCNFNTPNGNGCSIAGPTGWVQASTPWSTIVGSDVTICAAGHACTVRSFSGV